MTLCANTALGSGTWRSSPNPLTSRMRTLAEAEQYLNGFLNRERQSRFDYEALGLARIRAILEACGHPERDLPVIHIAGSKGKGSVALAAEALLIACGHRVGTYTSPHLSHWCERFRIDGVPVPGEILTRELARLRPALDALANDDRLSPSFFDVTTALALCLFRAARVGTSVIEVGLGGRLDSTNVVDARVSVLTSIQLEHTDKLGNTLGEIAAEKAGIMRPGIPFVHGFLESEALAVVTARADELGTGLTRVEARVREQNEDGIEFELADGRRLLAPVLGAHQAQNLALAVASVEALLGRSLEAVELGALERLSMPARLERIGEVLLDAAHTPDSARALADTLRAVWPGRRWTLVISVSSDKRADQILSILEPVTASAIVTVAEPTRSADPEAVAELARAAGIRDVRVEPDPLHALAGARKQSGDQRGVLVTGSLYLVGVVRPALVKS